jgi:hypothetical protein
LRLEMIEHDLTRCYVCGDASGLEDELVYVLEQQPSHTASNEPTDERVALCMSCAGAVDGLAITDFRQWGALMQLAAYGRWESPDARIRSHGEPLGSEAGWLPEKVAGWERIGPATWRRVPRQ